MNHPHRIFLFGVLLLSACRMDPDGMHRLDLTPHGLPLQIMAPDSAEVVVKDYEIMRDITIKKGEDFFVQIFEFEAAHLDAAGEKLRQLDAVRDDPFFKEIVREDDEGFIFSRQLDSTLMDFDFRFIRIMEEKELIFQTGLIGTFSLADVKRMYKSVQ